MNTRYYNIGSFLLVHCVGVVLSASYYQREYSGYSFTIPGFNDAEWRSQVDARTLCNGNGSKLLAITNQSIQTAVVAFINDAIRHNQITLNNIITDGQIATCGWTWINEATTPATLQIGGQEGGPAYTYAYLYVAPTLSSFSLFASTPTDKKYFICEGQVFCGNGYQHQGQCFQSFRNVSAQLSWFEARNLCLQRGGDLATFEFITTNDGLNALNGSWIIPASHYWIGLGRQWWTWQSINSEVTYSQWSDGQPIYDFRKQCLCLLPNDWKWSGCQCSQAYQFICISSAGTDSTTPSTRTSTLVRQSVFTTSISSTTTTTQSETQDENLSDNCSHLGVGLGVGLGIGIPLLLIIIALVIVVIQLKRKLRKYESIASSGTRVEMTSTPAYESLQNGTTTIHNSTYQELNVTN